MISLMMASSDPRSHCIRIYAISIVILQCFPFYVLLSCDIHNRMKVHHICFHTFLPWFYYDFLLFQTLLLLADNLFDFTSEFWIIFKILSLFLTIQLLSAKFLTSSCVKHWMKSILPRWLWLSQDLESKKHNLKSSNSLPARHRSQNIS